MTDKGNGPAYTGLKLALAFAIVLAAGVGLAFSLSDRSSAQRARPQATPVSIPVTTTRSLRQDVPLYVSGLGMVQAFNSVQVRSRVDGTLMQVPVTEGQEVKEGDILTVIDPRPYQAALDAATAKRAQDQADLNNAKRDFIRYTSLAQSSFASHQQVDTQQAMVNRLTAMIAGDDAAITTAQLNLGYCTIAAPFPIEHFAGHCQIAPEVQGGSDLAVLINH